MNLILSTVHAILSVISECPEQVSEAVIYDARLKIALDDNLLQKVLSLRVVRGVVLRDVVKAVIALFILELLEPVA